MKRVLSAYTVLGVICFLCIACTDIPFGTWSNPYDAAGKAPKVLGISFDKASVSLTGGTAKETADIVVSFQPATASNKQLIWTSDDSTKATISADGMIPGVVSTTTKATITGLRDGIATITATSADGNFKAKCTVTISGSTVTSVSLNKNSVLVGASGGHYQLLGTVSPFTASDKSITWSSSASGVVAVDSNGIVTGIGTSGSAIITATTNDGNKTAQCTVQVKDFAIGDTGQAGGIVFYRATDYSAGWRYLECPPTDTSNAAAWKNNLSDGSPAPYTLTGASDTSVGSGKSNTDKIIATYGRGDPNYAAVMCKDLKYGGFSDWYLPSKDELNAMYANIRTTAAFNTSSAYWSSTQYTVDIRGAYTVDFANGFIGTGYHIEIVFPIRATRQF